MSSKTKILIVDDEKDICNALEFILSRENYEVKVATSGEKAIQMINKENYDVVITDLKMGKIDGMEVLKHTKQVSPDTAVIIITAFGSIESAVEAMKTGANDYIIKPFYNEEIILTVKKNIEQKKLIKENLAYKQQLTYHRISYKNIIANSLSMQEVLETISKVAPTKSNVLILGESGTGKGLFAELIHYNSPRYDKPFISINCSAIPEGLLESELFGYKKGAFTGAISDKHGLLSLANEGTFFFDEIGDMPLNLQTKLLKVIETGEFFPLGDTKPSYIDIRFISATNSDLDAKIKEGSFREDLYWRLNVIEIKLPPLRERKDDIEPLVKEFIKNTALLHKKNVTSIDKNALNCLIEYSWPGNIRELKNVIERVVILANSDTIMLDDLPEKLRKEIHVNDLAPLKSYLNEYEKKVILNTYLSHNKKKEETAKALGIDIATLYRKMKKYNIED
ncbi:MAG: sigma-54 dependent transcriptional regulator [Thermodesulfovibrionales bacterium]|nr:sigma-54 dependent transcriptional regulator [Thermodesulfovibrionales bacterium]